MTAGGSAAREAARLRAQARGGWFRRLLAWLGILTTDRRLEAEAARREHGAVGEQWTADLLARLPAGWTVFHDLAVPRRRFNLDHVLIPPSGAGVIVLDSKRWHRGRPTTVVGGRLHCGQQDRHGQVEAVAGYASAVAAVLRVPAAMVEPLLVVHGSPVDGGGELVVRVPGWERTVLVVGTDRLLPTLLRVPGGRDPVAAGRLAARVGEVLEPYR
ncbi:nuclease-related domain-containing protein [Streptomyces sp. NPDC057837]|uniref:nuclease-related domain-containing protein n=1 Tax=Streptomyces sp. NPDC057837 TaxID=3346260 RepID=UPI0036C092D1